MTPILSPQKQLEGSMATTTPARGRTEDALRDQSRAIRDDHDKQPQPRNESPREARWRVEREKAAEQAKREPHKGY